MSTAAEVTREELAQYRANALKKYEEEQARLELRKQRAWDLARQAAQVLRTQYSVDRVVVFGSLVHAEGFTLWSDVDIAAWGIDARDTFRAIGTVMDLSDEIEINLVDIDTCSTSLRALIIQEGITV